MGQASIDRGAFHAEPNQAPRGQRFMARTQRYDLVILGGGTGGLVSAAIAAGLGARVALVEREAQPGGDCLWTGCVPSKSLLAAAELVHGVRHADRFGVRANVEPVDLAAVMGHVQDVQAQIAASWSRPAERPAPTTSVSSPPTSAPTNAAP